MSRSEKSNFFQWRVAIAIALVPFAILAGAQALAPAALAVSDPGRCVSLGIPGMPHAGWNDTTDEPCSVYESSEGNDKGVQPGAGFYGDGAIFGEELVEVRDPLKTNTQNASTPKVSTPPYCPTVASCLRTPTRQARSDPDRPRAAPREPKQTRGVLTKAEKEKRAKAREEADKARCRKLKKDFNDKYYEINPLSTGRADLAVDYYRRREAAMRAGRPLPIEPWREDPRVEAALKTWDARGCTSLLGEDMGEHRSPRVP